MAHPPISHDPLNEIIPKNIFYARKKLESIKDVLIIRESVEPNKNRKLFNFSYSKDGVL